MASAYGGRAQRLPTDTSSGLAVPGPEAPKVWWWARHRSGLGELTHGSVASRLRRLLTDVTVDVVRPDD